MKYYKRYWDENTGEKLSNSWGKSTYYFEVDTSERVTRQMQIFENSNILRYSTEKNTDKYGSLSDQPLDKDEFESFQMEKREFEQLWNSTNLNSLKNYWWKFWD